MPKATLTAEPAFLPLVSTRNAGETLPSRLRVTHLLMGVLALLVVGNLGRLEIFSAGVKQTPLLFNDLVVAGVVCAGGLAALRYRRFRLDRVALLALLFAAVGAGSALLAVPRFGLSPFELALSTAYLARWLLYFGLYLVVINFVTARDVPGVWRSLEAAILVFAAFGVVQSLFLPGFAQIVFPDHGWDLQGHRLVSTFLDPNFAGALIAVGLLMILAQIAHGLPVSVWKPILLFAALVLTISRSSALAFFAGVATILVLRGLSRRVLKLGALLCVLFLPFAPLAIEFAARFGKFSFGGSAAARLISWSRAIEVFLDNPVLGIGFNTYGFVQRSYGWIPTASADFALDGGLLFIAVMTGCIGLSVYSTMILLGLWRCRSIARDSSRSGADRAWALGVAAVTVGLVVHSVFVNSLLTTFLMEVLWVLWGGVFVLRSRAESTPRSGGGEALRYSSGCVLPLHR